MNELSLFSGAGGGLLGTKLLGFRHVGYVEWDDYCQRVIAQRIRDGILDNAPIFGDIEAFLSEGYAECYRGLVDLVSAGFPCQPFSQAGKRLGEADERNKWPETIAVIRAVRPRYVLLENVAALLNHPYASTVFGDLAEGGFDIRWCCISPTDAEDRFPGARLWVLAKAGGFDRPIPKYTPGVGIKSHRELPETWCKEGHIFTKSYGGRVWCFPDTDSVRSLDDMACWVDRLKALGNGQVPSVVKAAWHILGGPLV